MNGIFTWKVSDNGDHQLLYNEPGTVVNGSTASYRCPSTINFMGKTYAIFTQYWEGVFPTEEVLEIKTIAKARIKRVEEL